MSKKYLFSPVGNTDPIKYFYDGSMLHICRYYRPDVVYLYLSKEMAENHRLDNRYVKTLELLGEALHHTFEIQVIENEKMVEVQQYDVFYNEFREIIGSIEKQKAKEDILLVNMASGTPSMKSALLVMATLAEYRFLPIQVSTPKRSGNLEYENREDYDVQANWELDEDNKPESVNRCSEVRCLNLMRLLKIDVIKKHLLSYDYRAALEVGKDIKGELSVEAYNWLEAAAARSILDWEKMNKVLPKGNGILTPVQTDNLNRNLFEYALILDLKVRRGEYADFVRAITPLGVDLLETVLRENCGIEIEKFYQQNQTVKKWDLEKLKGTDLLKCLQKKFKTFKADVVYASNLEAIIREKCQDKLLKQRVSELLKVEKNARNIAAHNIVSVTQEWVQKQTGKTVSEIMWLIRYLCTRVKIKVREENWNSYDQMNEYIIRKLEE